MSKRNSSYSRQWSLLFHFEMKHDRWLPLCLVVTSGLLMFVASSCSPNEPDPVSINQTSTDGFTFTRTGKSFIEYRHQWPLNEGINFYLSVAFRTTKSSSFLFHHTYAEALPLLEGQRKPQLWVRLKKGTLYVTYAAGDGSDTVALGKGLSHDQWHRLFIFVDAMATNQLTVEVDSHKQKNFSIRSINWPSDFNESLTSVISVGGYSPEVSMQRGGHFVGCVKDLEISENRDGSQAVAPQVYALGGVDRGCKIPCSPVGNQCREGKQCPERRNECSTDGGTKEKSCGVSTVTLQGLEGVSSVTLQGSEWLVYNLYDAESGVSEVRWNQLAIEFKTMSSEGILFYGRELYPMYNHLAVSLHNASVHVSVIFVDQVSYSELFVSLGNKLDDDKWHKLLVTHNGQSVDVSVDSVVEKMSADRPDPRLHLPPSLYFGGMDVSASMLGLRSQKNFIGCLRGLAFNRDDVLQRLNSSRLKYHNEGPALFGCHNLASSAIQFTHDGAFAKLEHPVSDSLSLQMAFRTIKANCIVAYTETSAASRKGYIQISLAAGQLALCVTASVTTQDTNCFLIGSNLNDNKWHSVRVIYKNSFLQLEVDEAKRIETLHVSIILGDSTYLGFGPNTEMSSAFIGCMKSVKIQNSDLDPVKVIHSQLGVGITLGDCDLVDWCQANQSICQNGGKCISRWSGSVCDCSDAEHYEGKYCQTYVDYTTVTFKHFSHAFLIFRLSTQHDVLSSEISFSVRTSQRNGVLLILHEESLNITLSLTIQNMDLLVFRCSRSDGVKEKSGSFPGLSDGTWKNVTILQKNGNVERLTVNGISHEYPDGKTVKPNQQSNEKIGSSWDDESNLRINTTDWQVYVGGAPSFLMQEGSFSGCLSQLEIGDFQFQLAKAALGLPGIDSGCIAEACSVDGCQNGGQCVFDDRFPAPTDDGPDAGQFNHGRCDCSMTGWAGPKCDMNLQVTFGGQSMLVERLRIMEKPGDGGTTGIGYNIGMTFIFATTTAVPDGMVLAALQDIDGGNDFAVVYLTASGTVSMLWNIDQYSVLVEDDLLCGDGNPHRVLASRNHQDMVLQVDMNTHRLLVNTSKASEILATFYLGGIPANVSEFRDFNNFTGVISNAFVRSDQLQTTTASPIDVYFGFPDGNKGISIEGGARKLHDRVLMNRKSNRKQNEIENNPWKAHPNSLRSAAEASSLIETRQLSTTVEHRNSSAINISIGVGLLVAAFVVLFALANRWRRRLTRQRENSSMIGEFPTDEQEGLLEERGMVDIPSSAPGIDMYTEKYRSKSAKDSTRRTGMGEEAQMMMASMVMSRNPRSPLSTDPPSLTTGNTSRSGPDRSTGGLFGNPDAPVSKPSRRSSATRNCHLLHVEEDEEDEEAQMEWDPQSDIGSPILDQEFPADCSNIGSISSSSGNQFHASRRLADSVHYLHIDT